MEDYNIINFTNGLYTSDTDNYDQSTSSSGEDSKWENVNDFTKYGSSLNSSQVPIKNQNVQGRNLFSSYGFTSDNEKFCCYVCKKSFDYHHQLVHHKKSHKIQVQKLQKDHSPNGLECFNVSGAANSVELPVQGTSHNLMMNNCDLNIKKGKNSSELTDVSFQNNLTKQTLPQTIVINKLSGKEKPENNHLVGETYVSGAANGVELPVQGTSHNLMMNNCDLNIKQGKNSSELTDVSFQNNLTKQTLPQTIVINKLSGKEKPENNHLVGETEYFVIRKLTEYRCKICEKYVSANLHSFCVHMASHRENSMHECTVCDIKFPNVIFWTDHMLNHEKQILSLQNSENNHNEVEPNTNISTGSTKLSESVEKEPEDNNSIRETENFAIRKLSEYRCKICKKYVSANLHSFCVHMASHRESSMHKCIVCDIKFPNVISWTNHMLKHEEQILNLSNSENNCNEVEPNINISTGSKIMEERKKKQENYRTTFSSRGSYTFNKNAHILKENQVIAKGLKHEPNETNKMKLRHRVRNLNNMVNNNSGKSFNKTLSTEPNTYPSVSADKINNSVDVITNNASELNCCKICNKQFANPEYVAIHMQTHTTQNQIECQYCHRIINGKGPYINHMKFHTNLTKKNDVSYSERLNKNKLKKKYNQPTSTLKSKVSKIKTCNRKLFVCYICKRTFSNKGNCNRHIKRLHKMNVKRYQ